MSLLHDFPGVAHCHPPVFVQFNFIFLSYKQCDLQLGFQALHGAAEGRLGNVQLLRGIGQGSTLRHRYELLQLIEFKHVLPPLSHIISARFLEHKAQYAIWL